MAVTARPSIREPVSEMNTTPLIDVLLVLLVMLIITVPISTHSLDVDLPTGGHGPDLSKNSLILRAGGGLEWNGRPVTDAQLAGQLMLVRRMNPEPEVRFEPEADASYERSAQVMLIVKQSRVSNFGFAGNERYRTFDRR